MSHLHRVREPTAPTPPTRRAAQRQADQLQKPYSAREPSLTRRSPGAARTTEGRAAVARRPERGHRHGAHDEHRPGRHTAMPHRRTSYDGSARCRAAPRAHATIRAPPCARSSAVPSRPWSAAGTRKGHSASALPAAPSHGNHVASRQERHSKALALPRPLSRSHGSWNWASNAVSYAFA